MLQTITEYCIVLQSVADYCRVLQSITEYCRVLQIITKYYKDTSSASTWTNFWACFIPSRRSSSWLPAHHQDVTFVFLTILFSRNQFSSLSELTVLDLSNNRLSKVRKKINLMPSQFFTKQIMIKYLVRSVKGRSRVFTPSTSLI